MCLHRDGIWVHRGHIWYTEVVFGCIGSASGCTGVALSFTDVFFGCTRVTFCGTLVAFGCTGVAFGSLVVSCSCTRVGFGCAWITFGCTGIAFGCTGAVVSHTVIVFGCTRLHLLLDLCNLTNMLGRNEFRGQCKDNNSSEKDAMTLNSLLSRDHVGANL